MSTIILAAVEDAPSAHRVAALASAQAKLVGASELHLLHAVDLDRATSKPIGHPLGAAMMESGRRLLDHLVQETQASFGGRIVSHLAAGSPATEIVRLAKDLGAELVVVGTHGRGVLGRLVLGSVATKVVQQAPCAVFVARDKAEKEPLTPEIEPPCPACLARQTATNRAELWCDQHATKHARGHTHYEYPATYGLGSMLVRE